jgi:hypothetical protein
MGSIYILASNLEGIFEREEFAANATNWFALAINSFVFLGFLIVGPSRLLSFCSLGFS